MRAGSLLAGSPPSTIEVDSSYLVVGTPVGPQWLLVRFTGLWRHPAFLKLWVGQTVSRFGSQVSQLAIPLTAVLVLQATPSEMGILAAAETAPFLLIGLLAGVWVDRVRRRPVLIAGDIGRGLLLLTIPATAAAGLLRIEQLYLVGFLVGVLTVFFDVAYQSYLPALVSREHLVEGNSKLEVSSSAAAIGGPGLAGALVQLATAPLAVLVDALSFFASGAFLLAIRQPEPAPAPIGQRRGVWAEIGEGLQVVLGNRLLRPIAACTATANLFGSAGFAVLVLYASRELGIEPGLLGAIFAVGSVGFLLGALLAGPTAKRFGLGATIVGSSAIAGLGGLLVPLAGELPGLAVPLLVGAQLLFGLGVPIYNVNQVSLRQTITPDRLQGRMNASMRFVVWGTMPIGALLGGALGERIGLQTTLLLSALGMAAAAGWVLFSPVRTLRTQPAPVVEPAPATA